MAFPTKTGLTEIMIYLVILVENNIFFFKKFNMKIAAHIALIIMCANYPRLLNDGLKMINITYQQYRYHN